MSIGLSFVKRFWFVSEKHPNDSSLGNAHRFSCSTIRGNGQGRTLAVSAQGLTVRRLVPSLSDRVPSKEYAISHTRLLTQSRDPLESDLLCWQAGKMGPSSKGYQFARQKSRGCPAARSRESMSCELTLQPRGSARRPQRTKHTS